MKQYLFYLIFLAVCAILGFAVFYLARRTAFVWGVKATWLYVGYAIVLVGSLVGMMSGKNVSVGASVLVGVLIYLLAATLIVDLVHWGVPFSRCLFGVLVAVITLGLTGYSLWNAAHPRLKEVTITLPKLDKPLDIVQLSDVHLGRFRGKAHWQKLLDQALATQPKAIVITGDLFENAYGCTSETLASLDTVRLPIFFVNGNHDTYVDDAKIKRLLREKGVRVLENEIAFCDSLQLIGLNYMRPDSSSRDQMHAAHGTETIASVLPTLPIDTQRPTILLHHNPVGATYAEKAGVGLYLAGHTHGGQFWPVVWINDLLFKYNRGLYHLGSMQIYVSEGSGTFGPPMRLGTRSEFTLIHLVP